MPSASKLGKKEAYDSRLCEYLENYDRAFIVGADNVGSKQFQDIRRGLRPASVILMGKNTMMKRSIRMYCERTGNESWLPICDYLVGNVGIVFTKGELKDIKDEIAKYKVPAAARVGLVAPCAVTVKAGSTGMDPSATTFFQILGIATKINKGTIEIVSDVQVIKTGDKVGASEATLLAKLGIKPFTYGLQIQKVFDSGALFDLAVLDISDEQLMGGIMAGIQNVAALCLGADYPTLASIPHSVINGYKNVLAIAIATDYSFPLADKVKEFLKDPSKFAVAAAPAAAAAPAGGAAPAAGKKPEPEPKKEEEEEEDMAFDLFG